MKFINLNYLVILIYLISTNFSYSTDRPEIKNLIIYKNKKKIENVEFTNLNGEKLSLSDYSKNPKIINFWATWCAPCVHEMPQLDRLKFLLNDSDIEVLAVSEDRKGPAYVKKFLATNKLYNLETLIDKNGRLIRALKGRGLPTTVLFNRKGMEVGRVIGAAEWDSPEVLSYIRKCLGS